MGSAHKPIRISYHKNRMEVVKHKWFVPFHFWGLWGRLMLFDPNEQSPIFFFCLSIRFPVHIFVYRGLFLSRRRRWRAVCSLWFTHSLHLAEWVTWQYPLEEKAEFRTSVEECLLYILECNRPDTVYLII